MIFRPFYIFRSLLIVFILLSAGVFAQSLRIDGDYLSYLKMKAASEKDERSRCRWFNLIAEEYIKSYSIDSSKRYSYMTLRHASVQGWSSEEASALKNLVKANRANQFNSEYLTTRRESFESINRAIDLFTKLGDQRSLAECYFLYGTYFMFHAKYDKVLEYNRKARAIYMETGDSAGTAMCLGYLGGFYQKTGRTDSARICFERSMKVFEALGDIDQLVYILQGYSYLMIAEKKPEKALLLMERAVRFTEGSMNLFMIADIYNDYAAALLAAGRNDEAVSKLNEAHSIALRFGAQRLLTIICENLSLAHMNRGDYRQAAMYKDSVINYSQTYENILRQTALENEIYYGELELKKQEVQQKYYMLAFLTLLLGAGTFFLFFNSRHKQRMNRLLEQKNAIISDQNEELDKINHELEKRVLERTEDLIRARDRAEAADRMKTSFLAQMSHEIRTPINTILSFVSLIESEIGSGATEEMAEGFSIIDKGSRRLIRTIDMILTMSQFQAGNYEAEPVKLDLCKDILCKLRDEFSQHAKSKQIDFGISIDAGDAAITADEYSVLQLFQNLIDNAIKYTKQGFVRIKVYRDEAGCVCADISDSGIGISEDYLPRLFDSFSQEDTGYTRKFEGNGLGLALVKKYAEINGIDITVRSKKNEGTTFTLTFPT